MYTRPILVATVIVITVIILSHFFMTKEPFYGINVVGELTDADLNVAQGMPGPTGPPGPSGANISRTRIIDLGEEEYRLLDNINEIHRVRVSNKWDIKVPTKMTEGIYEVFILCDGGTNLDPHLYPMGQAPGNIATSYTYTHPDGRKMNYTFPSRNEFWWDSFAGGEGAHGYTKFTIHNLKGMYKRVQLEMGDTSGAGEGYGIWYNTELWDWIGTFKMMVSTIPQRMTAIVRKVA